MIAVVNACLFTTMELQAGQVRCAYVALSWTLAPPLLQARSWSGAAAASDGRAFAVGGMSLVPFFDPMDSVEMCNPSLRSQRTRITPRADT